MAKVKISDVAREAGVSLGTVSNALNHPEKLRPETLKLINETINRLGYLPNQSARQLAGGTTKSFGLVLPVSTTAFRSKLPAVPTTRHASTAMTCSSLTPTTTTFSKTITCATLWALRCPASWFSPWHPRLAPGHD